jgi:hypothetical protein
MTGRAAGRRVTRRRLACLAGLALVAGGLVLLATREGVFLAGDDAVYAGTARSVAAGHGLNVPIHYYPLGTVDIGTPPPGSWVPVPTPLVVYAPLQPVLLAVGGQNPVGTARVEDSIFFVLTVLMAGLIVLAVTDELWLAAAAQLIIGFSLAINVASLGTDGTALFLAIVGLGAIMRFRDRHGERWLVLGAVAVGLATLMRFAAGGLIVWGVLALWRRGRRRDALIFFLLSSAFLAGWFVYEDVSGRSTGHLVGFHIVKTTVRSGITAIGAWILPSGSSIGLAGLGTLVVVAVVVLVLRRGAGPVPWLLVLYGVVQIVILEVAITFFDAGVTVDARELMPVFLAVVLALACAVPRTAWVKVVTVAAVLGCVARFAVTNATEPPGGYTTPHWQHSALIRDVRSLPVHAVIYTDAPDVLYLLDNRATSSVPETVDFSTLKANPRFEAQIDEMRRTLAARPGYVVYVRGLGRDTFLPSEATLRRLLHLHRVADTSDGAIYTVNQHASAVILEQAPLRPGPRPLRAEESRR